MRKKLKLTKVAEKELKRTKGRSIRNEGCFCGCYWVDCGGSSEANNYNYN